MPTVLIKAGFRFGFWASDLREPPHIHAVGSGGRAKIWLVDPVKIEEAYGLTVSEQRKALSIVKNHRDRFLAIWDKARKEGTV
ncbi:MAG: DUF4160 domain-containing protein [Thermaerobacter sp.]|jgi:hypothetical protein|nr:DUF4160 domain-containing protein [Thermaerobacter sp.]